MSHACPSVILVGSSQKVHKHTVYGLHLYLGFRDENNTVSQPKNQFPTHER